MTSLYQHTISQRVSCSGIGVHTGTSGTVTLCPAEINTGVQFHVMDGLTVKCVILGLIQNVQPSLLRTVLFGEDCSVSTVEHLMSALSACNINNVVIQVSCSEIPIFDGSAINWLKLIDQAGVQPQLALAKRIKILSPVLVGNDKSWCRIDPCSEFSVNYSMSYDHPMIGTQVFDIEINQLSYTNDIAGARTFGFFKDFEFVTQHGLSKGVSLDNTVVFDQNSVRNPDGLRWPNEPVRHKILDIVGDLALAGSPIVGKFSGYRSGHHFNQQLVSKLLDTTTAWCWA